MNRILIAAALLVASPALSYLNEVPANSPGRWAGTRGSCLIGQSAMNTSAMNHWDNIRFFCLK